MHRVTRILVVLLVLTVSLVPTLSASAAEKPVGWEVIDAAVHQEGASNLLIVSGQLPDSAKLPANVELAVPAGSEIQWAGEILGGDVSNDPSVEYKIDTRDGSDVYSFTLTQARIGQIEALKPDVIVPSGDVNQASLTYTPAGDVSELHLKYRLAQTAKVQQPAEGAQMDAGPPGFSYYQRTVKNAKAGEPQTLAFTFTGGTAAPVPVSGAPTQGNGNTVALVLVLGLSIAGLVLLMMNVNRKMALKRTADPDAPAPTVPAESAAEPAAAIAQAQEPPHEFDVDEPEQAEDDHPTARPASRRGIVVAVIVTVLVAGAVFALNANRGGVATGDTVEMSYAQVDTCTTSNVSLTPPAGGSVESDKSKILESLRSVIGVGNATLHLKESRIEVRYCDSSVSEAQVLAALNGTGYTAQPLAPAAEEIQQAVPAQP